MLTSGLPGQLTAYMYMYFVYWCTSSQKRFYFFQLNPSHSQKIKVCLSLLLFLSLSVYAGSLREHNYQHRTITPLINAHTVRMRQFPAKDSFHALTIPPGIMAHKEAKTTSGFVIFLLLSEKEFRTLLFASSPFSFSFHFFSSYHCLDHPFFQATFHPSVHPTIYFLFLFSHICPHFLKSFFQSNPPSVFYFTGYKTQTVLSQCCPLCCLLLPSICLCFDHCFVLLSFSTCLNPFFFILPYHWSILPSIHPSVRLLVYRS